MSTPLLVLVVEIIILLLGLVVLLLFFRWKTKKEKTKDLEQLLDNIASQENTRQQILFDHLQKGYALEDEKAITLSTLLVNAEKQFMQVFIQQQIEQTAITDFHQTLCELLDQYLNTIPALNSPDLNLAVTVAEPEHVESPLDAMQDNIEEEQSQLKSDNLEPDNNNESDTTEEAEPSWDDAFSESGDKMDEASKEAIENEAATDAEIINEEEENGELNWDDAFSESGDEMDEATKQGMEAEQKQDN